jgi:hypothetical protein
MVSTAKSSYVSSGLNTTLQAPISKKLKGTLINLGPQTNKEIEHRKFDFVFTQNLATTKSSKEPSKKTAKTTMSKMKTMKLHRDRGAKN